MEMVKDFKKAVVNIRQEFKNYIVKSNLKSVVLGLSGGIDSALCAALAYDVCKELNISLIGRSIAIETNKPDENLRGKLIGEAFTTDYKHVDLTDAYLNLRPNVVENIENEDLTDFSFRLRMGNVKARMRMIYLYELAGKNKGMVLSTDNLTELLLGFWTLHGDVGDYGMIQQLWKTEVYQMAEYIAKNESNSEQKEALMSCVDAIPTDGLGITNSDLDQLQAKSYYEVDEILISYLHENKKEFENHPVIQRHLRSEFKRNNPFNISREIYF
ncbi:MAG: NAD(+) synthase [Bacteroidales bacterium]|nr:NAD(+) synthase [Bacteroidales bacterium]